MDNESRRGAAKDIVASLTGRRGFRQLWDEIDEDIQQEIVDDIDFIINEWSSDS